MDQGCPFSIFVSFSIYFPTISPFPYYFSFISLILYFLYMWEYRSVSYVWSELCVYRKCEWENKGAEGHVGWELGKGCYLCYGFCYYVHVLQIKGWGNIVWCCCYFFFLVKVLSNRVGCMVRWRKWVNLKTERSNLCVYNRIRSYFDCCFVMTK